MHVLAVIYGRAGSVGLPDKNGRNVAGRHMLDWTIDRAREAVLVDHIVFSTDSPHYAAAARRRTVPVVMRPPGLSDGDVSPFAPVRHALLETEQRCRCTYDAVVMLEGSCPVRPYGLIDRAVEKMGETDCDSVQSVAPITEQPAWMYELDQDHISPYLGDDQTTWRRQDCGNLHVLDGGVFLVRRDRLAMWTEEGGHRQVLGDDRRAVVNPTGAVIDIDTAADLEKAESHLQVSGTCGMWVC